MSLGRLLVVDNDRDFLESIRRRLESLGYEVAVAWNEEEARGAAAEQVVALAIIELQLGQQDGISLMEELRRTNPGMPAIILTARGSIGSAVKAMKRGAFTCLSKPFDARELALHVERALDNQRLAGEISRLKELLAERSDFNNIVARSPTMQRVLDAVSRVAKMDSTVHIHGESGTGKEFIARAVHLASGRKDKPFVAIDCAALPANLLESELFGGEQRAVPGAVSSPRGVFAQAQGGTLFLDEIGEMSLASQARLLRVLLEGPLYSVGDGKQVGADVRLIVATCRDLADLVKQELFREDLFYRIHVIPIELPPLRGRREDIPLLVEHFLKKFSTRQGKKVKGLTPAALQRLMLHDWPGNVRELENTIEYAVAMTMRKVITEDLVLPVRAGTTEEPVKNFKEARDAFERSYLVRLLELSSGNVSRAATLAGRYRADFYALLKKHMLNPGDFKK
jgi:two-component system, NtrC family, response regulator GlrR